MDLMNLPLYMSSLNLLVVLKYIYIHCICSISEIIALNLYFLVQSFWTSQFSRIFMVSKLVSLVLGSTRETNRSEA